MSVSYRGGLTLSHLPNLPVAPLTFEHPNVLVRAGLAAGLLAMADADFARYERETILRKARQAETGLHVSEGLRFPGSQAPK
jgi:hypothetical protein